MRLVFAFRKKPETNLARVEKISIPNDYDGERTCAYGEYVENTYFEDPSRNYEDYKDENNFLDNSAIALFSTLDLNNDGHLDIEFSPDELIVEVETVNQGSISMGPAMLK
jgi:hypothetical protein